MIPERIEMTRIDLGLFRILFIEEEKKARLKNQRIEKLLAPIPKLTRSLVIGNLAA